MNIFCNTKLNKKYLYPITNHSKPNPVCVKYTHLVKLWCQKFGTH